MLDYKDIIIKRYKLKLSGWEIVRQLGVSKSGIDEFLKVSKTAIHGSTSCQEIDTPKCLK